MVDRRTRWLVPLFFVLVLWAAREVLTPFVIGAVLAYVLTPLSYELDERTPLGKRTAAVVVLIGFVALVVLGGWALANRLAEEASSGGPDAPGVVEAVVTRFTGGRPVELLGRTFSVHELAERASDAIDDQLGTPASALHAVRLALDVTLKLLVVLVALAYFLLDGHRIGSWVLRFVPLEHQDNVEDVAGRIHRVLGRYVQGQVVLVLLVSVATYVGLKWIFHLPHALPVAIASGFLEIIPLLGPFIAGGVAAAIGLTQGGLPEAGGIAVMFLVIRQVEDQLMMPLIVGRAVHVHPLVTIFAVVVGEHMAGALGALLAVPIAAAAKVILDYLVPPPPEPREGPAAAPAAATTPPPAIPATTPHGAQA